MAHNKLTKSKPRSSIIVNKTLRNSRTSLSTTYKSKSWTWMKMKMAASSWVNSSKREYSKVWRITSNLTIVSEMTLMSSLAGLVRKEKLLKFLSAIKTRTTKSSSPSLQGDKLTPIHRLERTYKLRSRRHRITSPIWCHRASLESLRIWFQAQSQGLKVKTAWGPISRVRIII